MSEERVVFNLDVKLAGDPAAKVASIGLAAETSVVEIEGGLGAALTDTTIKLNAVSNDSSVAFGKMGTEVSKSTAQVRTLNQELTKTSALGSKAGNSLKAGGGLGGGGAGKGGLFGGASLGGGAAIAAGTFATASLVRGLVPDDKPELKSNLGTIATNVGGGAAAGFAFGGPIGAAVGAGIGALGSLPQVIDLFTGATEKARLETERRAEADKKAASLVKKFSEEISLATQLRKIQSKQEQFLIGALGSLRGESSEQIAVNQARAKRKEFAGDESDIQKKIKNREEAIAGTSSKADKANLRSEIRGFKDDLQKLSKTRAANEETLKRVLIPKLEIRQVQDHEKNKQNPLIRDALKFEIKNIDEARKRLRDGSLKPLAPLGHSVSVSINTDANQVAATIADAVKEKLEGLASSVDVTIDENLIHRATFNRVNNPINV